jgi:hypothetical protein
MNLNSIWADCKESYDLFNKSLYSVYRKMLEEKTIPQRFIVDPKNWTQNQGWLR